jgi:hypothetical protein
VIVSPDCVVLVPDKVGQATSIVPIGAKGSGPTGM